VCWPTCAIGALPKSQRCILATASSETLIEYTMLVREKQIQHDQVNYFLNNPGFNSEQTFGEGDFCNLKVLFIKGFSVTRLKEIAYCFQLTAVVRPRLIKLSKS